MQRIAEDNIGFALVKRRFESSGRVFMSGEELDRDFLLRMPRGNRDAMCDSKQIEIYPRAVGRNSTPVKGELHLRAAGVGVYDVIQGMIVASNKTKEEAQAIIDGQASQPEEKKASEAATEEHVKKPRRKAKRKAKRAKKARAVAKPREPKAPRIPKPETAEQQNGPID